MSLNLENLPASPATRGRAPKLMTARRRRLWIAVLVLVGAGVAASILLWRYQPLTQGPGFGPLDGDTDIWKSHVGQIYVAEFRDGAAFEFAFSLENTGRVTVTIEELFPGHRDWCGFNPDRVSARVGRANDVFDGSGTELALPVSVRPGDFVNLRVEGRLGGGEASPCDTDASLVTTGDLVPARVRTGWMTRTVDLPMGTRIGWGRGVEEYLSPSPAN